MNEFINVYFTGVYFVTRPFRCGTRLVRHISTLFFLSTWFGLQLLKLLH